MNSVVLPFHQPPDLLLEWLGLVSLVGFAAMGVDKGLAVGAHSRISERTLWSAALLGGFVGVIIGSYVFHHKTSKAEFWWPVVVSALVWAAAWQLFSGPI